MLEGAGFKDTAQGQRDVAAATKEATKAAEEQKRTVSQGVGVDNTAAKGKEELANASKKTAGALDDVKKAGGPAGQIMSGLNQAAQGGAQGILGLANVVRGLVATFAAGFGPAGTIAVAIGAVLGVFLAFKDKIIGASGEITESIEDVKKAAAALEQIKLSSFAQELERIQKIQDGQVESAKLRLDLAKKEADAQTALGIAIVQAQAATGKISQPAAKQVIAGLQLQQQVRNTQEPAQRADLEAKAARNEADTLQGAEAELNTRREAFTTLIADMSSEIKDLNGRIGELGRSGADPDRRRIIPLPAEAVDGISAAQSDIRPGGPHESQGLNFCP